jgi:hypothetical protein
MFENFWDEKSGAKIKPTTISNLIRYPNMSRIYLLLSALRERVLIEVFDKGR